MNEPAGTTDFSVLVKIKPVRARDAEEAANFTRDAFIALGTIRLLGFPIEVEVIDSIRILPPDPATTGQASAAELQEEA